MLRDGQPALQVAPTLQVGNRIWRCVDADTVKNNDRGFERTERGWALRAAYSYERRAWCVAQFGIICFCDSDIPDDWTYFRVIRVDRYRAPGRNERLHALVAPVAGREDELLRRFGKESRNLEHPKEICVAG